MGREPTFFVLDEDEHVGEKGTQVMADAQREKIRALVTPAIDAAGYELVDIEWGAEKGRWLLRLYIDRRIATTHDSGEPATGVSHEDCERVSREVSALLDVHDLITQAFTLEVSSPGLNRPLRSLDHFRRYIGEEAKIRLKNGLAGRRNFTGTIVGVKEDGPHVIVAAGGAEFAIPLADLDKANLQYRFE